MNFAFDFIGVAEHEISEVMGRYGIGQSGGISPIDLFRYSAPSVRNFLPFPPFDAGYFSIDSGMTVINTFNSTGSGDVADWAGLTADAYNAFFLRGREQDISLGDITVMDVLGYDQTTATVPEPSTWLLLGSGLVGLVLWRRKRTA